MHPLLSLACVGAAITAATLLAQTDEPPDGFQALTYDSIALDGWVPGDGPGRTMRAERTDRAPRLRGRARPGSNAHRLARLIKKYVEPAYWRITPSARCFASGENTLVIEAHPVIGDKVNRFLQAVRAWYA